MSRSGTVHAYFVGLVFILILPVPGYGQKLLAEQPHSSPSSHCCGAPPAVSMTFCLGYGYPTFVVGTPPSDNTLNPVIGCGQPSFSSGLSPTYFDFHVGNSPQFTSIATNLTNTTHESLWFCAISVDSNNNVTTASGCAGDLEPALDGSVVDFIRLVVNKVVLSSTSSGNVADSDVVWQFWNGPSQFAGGGQRAEVNEFLQYRSPLESSTLLPAGTTIFPVTILYGPTIDSGTFAVQLNGQSFGAFTPTPGTTQTVYVPLSQGRNVLVFSVDGLTSNGGMAKDRDRLVLIVP